MTCSHVYIQKFTYSRQVILCAFTYSLVEIFLQISVYVYTYAHHVCTCVHYVYRYCILTPETYPHWSGTVTEGIKHLMQTVNMEPDQWQLGKAKVFIKSPESVS